jgi:1-acyl-sn-glycerol-3-phosphate acyltransferase
MNGVLKHPLRVVARLFWLAGELCLAAVRFFWICSFRPKISVPLARGLWLQQSSRRLLRIFRLHPQVSGPIPSSGLLVCNHLGYLDVLVLASRACAVFVAKREVKSWPVLGWFASLAGTLYVHRERRTKVGETMREIKAVLDNGMLVVLFPEGTSSGGQAVLPFKSSLLEPAVQQNYPLSAGLIQYHLDDGDASEEVCYWKDMTFLPHLLNLLSKHAVHAFVQFAQVHQRKSDRKELARQLHSEIVRLKAMASVASQHLSLQQPEARIPV